MDKSEFCALLVDLRNQAGMSKYRMCKSMDMLDTHLNRIERGTHSFGISKAIQYLDVLGAQIVVTKGGEVFAITSREKLASVAQMIRRNMDMAFQPMADYIGVSKSTIMNIEKNDTDTGIVNFLQFFEKSGFDVQIVHK